MEKLQSHKLHLTPVCLLLFVLQFYSLWSVFTLPDKYFVNCGSESNINDAGRDFVGDLNSSSFSFTKSSYVKDSKQSSVMATLYQTARIFRQAYSSYEFQINDYGTYMVRLHFFTFTSPTDLSKARFDVSASGFSLLQNFTPHNSGNSAELHEFLVSINIAKFMIYFNPRESSFAFVSAVEVILANETLIPDEAPRVSRAGSHGSYSGIVSLLLRKVHRVNVGALMITPEDDTLWRRWVPDDVYLYSKNVAKNSSVTYKPNYVQGKANEYVAPILVYQTAKEMNINPDTEFNFFNITWSFNVSKNATHFVRVHFSDIVSTSENAIIFNLYIYSNFNQKIYPYEIINQKASPFCFDFVVDSDNSGLMDISIGPRQETSEENAFLNGLEIMEIMETTDGMANSALVKKPRKQNVFVVVGSVLGGVAVMFIVLVFFLGGHKCRKPKPIETSVWLPVHAYGGSSHGSITASPAGHLYLGLKIPFTDIQVATKNFNPKLLIGKGGFGNVYKGTLRNGIQVAVKRSQPGSGQGLPEFQTEIMVLSKIRHRHLVSLIGYCDERFEMILVYEFMEYGTLKDHLYHSSFPSLSWKQRLEICIGAARGLHYLHTGSAGGIIHRDVKSTNILLDKNYVAKVADFGLSRSGPLDQTYVSTGVKGSFGYLDPEYFRTQQLTDKSDVYSFGVVLLEVLCARPAINPELPREQVNLAEWGMLCKDKGLLEQIVDPLLTGQINPNSLRKFSETAEKCLAEDGADRPNMGDVLWDLEYALQLQKTPVRRAPHEDSTSDPSMGLALHTARSFHSNSFSIEGDDMPILMDDGSAVASEVFSQLKTDHSR